MSGERFQSEAMETGVEWCHLRVLRLDGHAYSFILSKSGEILDLINHKHVKDKYAKDTTTTVTQREGAVEFPACCRQLNRSTVC